MNKYGFRKSRHISWKKQAWKLVVLLVFFTTVWVPWLYICLWINILCSFKVEQIQICKQSLYVEKVYIELLYKYKDCCKVKLVFLAMMLDALMAAWFDNWWTIASNWFSAGYDYCIINSLCKNHTLFYLFYMLY